LKVHALVRGVSLSSLLAPRFAPASRSARTFMPHNVLIKWFLSSHFIHKPVKLLFTIFVTKLN